MDTTVFELCKILNRDVKVVWKRFLHFKNLHSKLQDFYVQNTHRLQFNFTDNILQIFCIR